MGETWMRVMYVVAIGGAGVVGALTLASPRLAAQYVLPGVPLPNAALGILGSVWLAAGVTAALGLMNPAAFSALFVLQLVYKGVWLVVVAPAGLRDGTVPPFLVGLFGAWVVGLLFAVPWSGLLGRGV